MSEPDNEMLTKVQRYRDLQVQFEALTDSIQALMRANGGRTEHMTVADLQQYRHLARERDEVTSEMRYLEPQLFGDYDEM